MNGVEIALAALALVFAVPAMIFFVECMASLFPAKRRANEPASVPRFVVLVPAHDEAAGIGNTLAALHADGESDARIVVVADNCTDDTAAVARAHGAEVVERHDPERRGKGFALAFGAAYLDHEDPLQRPEVLVVLDADCRVSAAALGRLAAQAHESGRPVQADYVLRPTVPSGLACVSGLAILVKNVARPAGMRRLGLPCPLTGSGMAFPFPLFRSVPPTGSYLVEDMLIGVEMAKRGNPPLASGEVHVDSELPERREAAMGQRKRWEHGHLTTMLREGPALLWWGLCKARFDVAAMGLDLLVPPLALLVMALGLTAATGGTLWWWSGNAVPFAISSSSLALVATGVLAAWFRFGRTHIPARSLLAVPCYLAWKVPLYLAFFLRRGEQQWNRTERSPGS